MANNDDSERSRVEEYLTTQKYMNINAQFCAPTHYPISIVLTHGQGARVWDVEGKEYIDFLSAFSVVNQGHCHPQIVKAMVEQCQRLTICTSAIQNKVYPLLCEKICKVIHQI
jgi:ornithine--oxo-acid transaminase